MAVARELTKNVFNLRSNGKLLWKSMAGGWDRNDNLMLHEDFLPGYKTREDLEFKKAVKLALTDDHKHLVRVECPSPHLGCGPARMLSARARHSVSLTLQESAVSHKLSLWDAVGRLCQLRKDKLQQSDYSPSSTIIRASICFAVSGEWPE